MSRVLILEMMVLDELPHLHEIYAFAYSIFSLALFDECLRIPFLHNYCRNVDKQNVRLEQTFSQ